MTLLEELLIVADRNLDTSGEWARYLKKRERQGVQAERDVDAYLDGEITEKEWEEGNGF